MTSQEHNDFDERLERFCDSTWHEGEKREGGWRSPDWLRMRDEILPELGLSMSANVADMKAGYCPCVCLTRDGLHSLCGR